MLEILELVNNNIVYICIIIVLIAIIIFTMLSMKKDRDKIVNSKKIKEVEQPIEPAKTEKEREYAKLELEKVVNSMKNNLENKKEYNEIDTYEQEQEEKAIISYQELVEAVRKNNASHKSQTEIGMEVASKEVIEEPTSPEEVMYNEELDKKADNLVDILKTISPTKEPEKEEVVETKLEVEIKEEPKEEKKFKTTEFISPIYGRQNNETTEENNDLNKILNDDITDTDEFLDSLRNFRSKL